MATEHEHNWYWQFDGYDWDRGDFMGCDCGAERELGKRERLELIRDLAASVPDGY